MPERREIFYLSRRRYPIRCCCWDICACPEGNVVSIPWPKLLNLLAVISTVASMLSAQEFHERDLKAVFLLRFGSFMEWPPPPAGAEQDFVIGVLGEDGVFPVLEAAVAGETIGGRRVRAVHFRGVHEVRDCQILFISRSRGSRLRHILNVLRGRPILTVSDIDEFTESGGMIHLRPEGGRFRLRVNIDAARAANISISSKLLRVVEIVGEPPKGA